MKRASTWVLLITLLLFLSFVNFAQAQEPAPVTPTPWVVVVTATPTAEINTLEILSLHNAPQRNLSEAAILGILDQHLPQVWERVQRVQAAYFEQTGRYIQGLPSHSVIPANGAQVCPDLYLTFPSDFPATWQDTNVLPFSPSAYSYRVDVYSGPYGEGYVFCVQTTIDGATFEQCYNHGGELWRAHEWEIVSAK